MKFHMVRWESQTHGETTFAHGRNSHHCSSRQDLDPQSWRASLRHLPVIHNLSPEEVNVKCRPCCREKKGLLPQAKL